MLLSWFIVGTHAHGHARVPSPSALCFGLGPCLARPLKQHVPHDEAVRPWEGTGRVVDLFWRGMFAWAKTQAACTYACFLRADTSAPSKTHGHSLSVPRTKNETGCRSLPAQTCAPPALRGTCRPTSAPVRRG